MEDPHDLERFVVAQDGGSTYDVAVKELRAGRKETHWIWFVFPQMRGLGVSDYAIRYGIATAAEGAAYLQHEVLGPRLRHCTNLVLRSPVVNPAILMGTTVDALKLQSSMTLFAEVADDDADFVAVLGKYYHGGRDLKTLELLRTIETKRKSDLAEKPVPTERGFWSWLRRH
ncbi:MAG: DUF1810 domain-containing protein [Mycolicibacterium cosmeticum]|nr:DUF1810 domain-containing protein [Mycolicibacterium cosmeticum]